MVDLWSKRLRDELLGEVTDEFLELLLKGMDLAFFFSQSYRKNIEGFRGKYLFRTFDNRISASAIFEDSDMKVDDDAVDDWDAKVTFKDAASLRGFLFSKDQDILNSILANDVEVEGNLNYIYRFGFLVKDLGRRLGVV